MGVQDGQMRDWPSSRNPHRCLKAAKAAKAANVVVTVVTELTLLMHAVFAILAPTLSWSEKPSLWAGRGAPPSGSRGRRGERLQRDPVTERLQPPDRAALDGGAVAALEEVGPQLLIDVVASEQMVRDD